MSSFIIAFAMYSRIPMPKVAWNEKNMKYAICYFPLVGGVIGVLETGIFWLCHKLDCSMILRGILLTAIPLLVTGGIHMDGFLDTVDARSSYGDRERKLEILKDPHTGAFAMIKGILYLLLQVGFFCELSWKGIFYYSWIFVLSRGMSGYALASFQGAKTTGLLTSFAEGADKKVVRIIMILYYTGGLVAMMMAGALWLDTGSARWLLFCVGVILSTLGTFLYYRCFSYREFHGITGDLAGYFLQLVELVTLMVCVFIEKVCVWF